MNSQHSVAISSYAAVLASTFSHFSVSLKMCRGPCLLLEHFIWNKLTIYFSLIS